MLAILPLSMAFISCDDDLHRGGKSSQADYNEPCQEWGLPLTSVKQLMQDFKLLAEDDDMLVYEGNRKESIISYGFESQKLCSASVFISTDSIEITDLTQSFSRYEQLSDYDELTYVYATTNTVGEIALVEKSDNTYYCLSCSYLNDLE